MRHEDRERGPDSAARSDETPDVEAIGVTLTPADERIGEALGAGLGRLRAARPGFQEELECRLLDRLSEPARPWWRRVAPARTQARPRRLGLARLPRRSLLGLAAATALALTAASLSLPLVGTPAVSAREILEKVQANSENPMLAGVKSFHLTAKLWNDGGPRDDAGPHEMTTEQWFVSPDKMRTESRGKDSSGKSVVSGMMMNGSQMRQYSTDGATDVFMFGVFAAPIGAKPGSGEVREIQAVGSHPPGGTPVAGGFTAGAPVTAPPDGTASDKPFVAHFVRAAKDGNGKEDVEENVIVFGDQCPEPKRTGEATVAGRAVLVIENDFSDCLPANAPVKLPARHIRWVDKATYLPLKMEANDKSGKLVERYEVTSIEYDVSIADKTFTELPAGTTQRELMMPPLRPDGEVVGPGVPASKPKTP